MEKLLLLQSVKSSVGLHMDQLQLRVLGSFKEIVIPHVGGGVPYLI